MRCGPTACNPPASTTPSPGPAASSAKAQTASRLPSATDRGLLRLSDDVGSDWYRASRLIDQSRHTDEATEWALLRAALEQVTGRPFADTPPNRYRWVYDDRQLLSHIEVALSAAAERLAELALAHEDPGTCEWAAGVGLRVQPAAETFHRWRMRAAAKTGNRHALTRAYRDPQAAAQTLDPTATVEPETEALHRELHARRHGEER